VKPCPHKQRLKPDTGMAIGLGRDAPPTGNRATHREPWLKEVSPLPSREKQQQGEDNPHQGMLFPIPALTTGNFGK